MVVTWKRGNPPLPPPPARRYQRNALSYQNDASPYVEKWIQRCRLVHKAIHASSPCSTDGGASASASATGKSAAPEPATGDPHRSADSASLLDRRRREEGGEVGVGGGGSSALARAGTKADLLPMPSPTPTLPPPVMENGAGVSNGAASSAAPRRVDAALLVPTRARELAWRGVVDATLLSLLRGFSRAKRCSTEGRALMSMDLQVRACGSRGLRWWHRFAGLDLR